MARSFTVRVVRVLGMGLLVSGMSAAWAGEPAPWPAPVPGYVPPKPGEHPRLFFRVADIPKMRARAKTPEGQAIIARCKKILGGGEAVRLEKGQYTLFDGAAFGFLYQVTGDKKYAELARQSVEHGWEQGVTDRDDRLSLNPPNEPMRYGPSLAAVAMAYDLNYDAWPEDFRTAQAKRMQDHAANCKKRGGNISLQRMATGADNPNPVSNHYGLQIGGAGLTLLAIQGDPGTDDAKVKSWLQGVDRQARKVMTEDFGETGYFAEHAGPGVIAMTWTFTPWLLAERVCGGRDWVSPRPGGLAAEWMSLRFVYQTIPVGDRPLYLNPSPQGGYGTELVAQDGGHHATLFCQGFGAIQPKHKPAMKWVYEQFVQPLEIKQYAAVVEAGKPTFDVFTWPHRAMFAFVNWPFDLATENPEKSIPKAIGDKHFGHFFFRNRWQDANDSFVGVLFGARTSDRNVKRLMVWSLGQQMEFCSLTPSVVGDGRVGRIGEIKAWKPAVDGSGVVSVGGTSVGVDFSKASGADCVVVVVGDGATGNLNNGGPKSKATVVEAGGKKFAILVVSSAALPEPKVEGDKVTIGGQSVGFDGTAITFSKMAGPSVIPQ